MTARISKWGNSAAIRLPKEIMDFLSLHIGDNVQIIEENNAITITLVDEKKERLIAEAKRIKTQASKEFELLEGTLDDGLSHV
jgi:antitoxin MazE